MNTQSILVAMALDLVAINRATGNVAALVLCDLQDDLWRIAMGMALEGVTA